METKTSISALPPPDPARSRRLPLRLFALATVLALLTWSWIDAQIGSNLKAMLGSSEAFTRFIAAMFPPDLAWTAGDNTLFGAPLRTAFYAAVITLQISILGTALGMIVALVFGFLGAESLTPHWLHHPIKVFLALLRSIPVLLLAIIFFVSAGFGALPGVLAIAIHSVGMLGKLFAEECEQVDLGVWEAMDSAGANWFQKIRYAIWPQVAAPIYSLTLFRLDMNLRESAVLGFIGIAGLGLAAENYRKAFLYTSMTTVILVTMLLVLIVDQTSVYIRRKLK